LKNKKKRGGGGGGGVANKLFVANLLSMEGSGLVLPEASGIAPNWKERRMRYI